MSTTTQVLPAPPVSPGRPGPTGWHRLLVMAAVTDVVLAVIVQVAFERAVIPPLCVVSALVAVALLVATRYGHRWWFAVAALEIVWFAGDAAHSSPELAHPDGFATFVVAVAAQVAVLLTVLGILGLLLRWPSRIARAAAVAAGGALAVAVVVSAALALSAGSTNGQAGDVELTASSLAFTPERLTAHAGSVGVHIRNRDPVRHTFAVEQLGVEIQLPAGRARRASFDAPPGTYTYRCTVAGHTNMKGILVVQ
ncbi:MAG: hypothetical protein QOG64_1681 [Acidimicrobiaceae bacterium]|nr:hypothetical protein [Acidimicrobiaceae bacterium]